MIRLTIKNFIVATLVLVVVVCSLYFVDSDTSVDVSAEESTRIRVTVVSVVDNSTVHNATIDIDIGTQFFTDNNGLSPTIEIPLLANRYDNSITEWYCVDVVVTKQGYVPTVVVGCVLYAGQLRQLTVYMYQQDDNSSPYVCYVESPPSDYLTELIG